MSREVDEVGVHLTIPHTRIFDGPPEGVVPEGATGFEEDQIRSAWREMVGKSQQLAEIGEYWHSVALDAEKVSTGWRFDGGSGRWIPTSYAIELEHAANRLVTLRTAVQHRLAVMGLD